ncbi:potassium-transporting ATPase subunit KdpC [Streptomyces meridianus]|uniref:Potassium-transporting ATPase KdpC subunit n=1 Tax=Streptomyces meridianus TaxID=2938945 RepID=A0ABT0XF49_9ACTN|nr:potassium-transporting ATPase subunit KdpC [Streptomyces meridianus]MCM2580578.1 potassium-transporting ATPase subunit KdpC [Streptomyces meridianus]
MSTSAANTGRLLGAGVRALLVLTLLCGVVYPLLVTGIAQGLFHGNANGSEVEHNGKVVGSELYGQTFDLPKKDPDDSDEAARPDPKWFQPRPSAAGTNSVNTQYSILLSGASNLAADSKVLKDAVVERRRAYAELNGVEESRVPVDAVTASASGIDPHISPENAELQAARVAEANGLDTARIRQLVAEHTDGRIAGFLGEPRVNVLQLNIALRDLIRN